MLTHNFGKSQKWRRHFVVYNPKKIASRYSRGWGSSFNLAKVCIAVGARNNKRLLTFADLAALSLLQDLLLLRAVQRRTVPLGVRPITVEPAVGAEAGGAALGPVRRAVRDRHAEASALG